MNPIPLVRGVVVNTKGKYWHNLDDYIRDLLRDGKRSNHEDFQVLFRIYGQDTIVAKAKRILAEAREERDADDSY